MGKLSQFIIVLTNPQPVYYAGQMLEGNVHMTLGEEMKMRGIHLKMVGEAKVHWSEQHTTGTGKNRHTTTRHYRNSETYFRNEIILFGNQGGVFSDSTKHPAGTYTFPFQFQLPPNLPSSFEGEHGSVRYYVKCNIDRPWKFDHNTKTVISVVSQLDLNQVPDALNAPQGQNSKTLCCLCCASGPIEATCKLDRRGYVPGENILVNAVVSNGASRKVDATRAELHMITRFHATSKTRSTHRKVGVEQMGSIPGGETQNWSNAPLHIPPLPPSGLVGCNIIDIEYYIEFVVDPSGPALDLEVRLPITIGTIPLRNFFDQYNSAAQMAGFGMPPSYGMPAASGAGAYPPPTAIGFEAAGNVPPPPTAPPMYPGALPDAPPPSYQESVFGQVSTIDEDENEHLRGTTSYAPVYSYYNWEKTQYSLPL